MKKQNRKNDSSQDRNLRLGPLDYSGHENSFWGIEIFKKFEEVFKIDQFCFNLKKINNLAKNDFRYTPFSNFYSHYWKIYEHSINDFKKYFIDSAALLSKTIRLADAGNAITFKNIKELVHDRLTHASQSWVIVSDDHRISHATIKELVSRCKTKTSIVVIDNHADIYGNALAKNNPLKFNPFRYLIESHWVEHVFFLCPKFTEILNDKKTWRNISGDISLVPFCVASGGELVFDQKLFEATFSEIVKRKRIQNIFFSIDIDALVDISQKKLYTAFEYSILNSFLYLSLLSSEQVQHIDSLLNTSVELKEVFANRNIPAQKIKLRNPYRPGLNTVNEIGISPLVYIETIKTICELAKNMNVKIGLGSCVGEIVELLGPDWKGETTQVVLRLIETLDSLS